MASQRNIGHRHPFVKKVAGALRRRCGVERGQTLVAAVSGGADSVAMLRALHAIAARNDWRLTLVVGHVQHHLRPAAEDDARFVAALAKGLGLPLARRDVDVDRSGNVENNARRLRYAALAGIAAEHDAHAAATAHHGDDQLETILMRLIRGTGVRGLRGIAWRKRINAPDGERHVRVVRPMLAADRRQIIGFLREIDQPWCEDHTNADTQRARARLRADVLPVLRDLRADCADKAVRLGDHCRGLVRAVERLQAQARRRLMTNGKPNVLDRSAARRTARPILAGVLRQALLDAGVSADRLSQQTLRPALRAIRDKEGGRRSFDFEGGVRMVVTRNVVEIDASA